MFITLGIISATLPTWAVAAFSALVGVVVTALAARWIVLRQFRMVRLAERRALRAERMAELGAMAGGLAHEIKNPLSTIGLNAELLTESISDLNVSDEDKQRLIRRIGSLGREVDRLRGILSDFLDYAGEIRLDQSPVNLNDLLEELVDFFHPQAAKLGITLRADPYTSPVVAHVDSRHIKQAVLNLMLNAAQAMEQYPRLPSQEATSRRANELILRVRPARGDHDEEVAEIHVIDTGPGIEPEQVKRIFQPYFTTKSGGSGLGLPTSRRLVEAHGGQLSVIAEPGMGSDFVLTIPCRPNTEDEASTSS
ncbi:MAG: HAMP domain-containing sensor histidine kinase [Phycisphaerales bacterium]